MAEPEPELARPPGGPGPPAPPGSADGGPPDDVMTARLVGGLMDGLIVEIESGVERLEIGPPLMLSGPAFDEMPTSERERLERGGFEYRYVGVEDVADPVETNESPRRALFQATEPDD